ncbi:MAG: PAS domain S-box protein, partial [Bacteroidia bacterium]|nr:PAS domain S-box protein [Bacteroidia bacterium]
MPLNSEISINKVMKELHQQIGQLKIENANLKHRYRIAKYVTDDLEEQRLALVEKSKEIVHLSQKLEDLNKEAQFRSEEILEAVNCFAHLDFTKELPISNKTDVFDKIAIGLNMLSEELQSSTVSRNFFDSILQSMPDMVLVLNPDGKIRTVNLATTDTLGYKEEGLIGLPFGALFAEEEEEEVPFLKT